MKVFEILKNEFRFEKIQTSTQKLILLFIGIITALAISAIMFSCAAESSTLRHGLSQMN